MQLRVCDRCRFPVDGIPSQRFVAGVTVPLALPSSLPVAADTPITLSIAVAAPGDLCPSCRRAAILEYLAQDVNTANVPDDARALIKRFRDVLKS